MEHSPFWEANTSSASKKNSPHFMEPEGPLPHSQQPALCPYPEPDRFHAPSNYSKIHFNIIRLSTPGYSKWSSFPQVSPLKPCMYVSPPPCVLRTLSISVHFTWSPEWYLVRSTEHKAPYYVVFSTPLLPCPSYAQTSSSAPFSRKPSAYVPPSMSATKFHTHTNKRQNCSR